MPETKQAEAARIAERNRVDAFMQNALAKQRAAGVKVGGSPNTSLDVDTQHNANNVRQWFTPPALQAAAKAMGAQAIGDKPTADQIKQLQKPDPSHPAVQKLAKDLAGHADVKQAMTDQLARHPEVQAAAMQHSDKKNGVPDDVVKNLTSSLVKQFVSQAPQSGMQQLQGSLDNQPQPQQPPQPQDQGQQ